METPGLGPAPGETQTPPPDFETALKEAQTGFYDLTFEDGFTELATRRGLSEDDTDKPEYWKAAADFAHDRALDNGEHDTLDELLAATPDYIYTQMALNRGRHSFPSREAYDEAKDRASYFQGLIGGVAQKHPDAKPSAMVKALLNTSNISVEDKEAKLASTKELRAAVRGAQHETGYGQLLEKTGRNFGKGDDRKGEDYQVAGRRGRVLNIDVKASVNEIAGKGAHGSVYVVDQRDGLITMYSLISDSEFKDSFYVSDEVAERKGKTLGELLDYIELHEPAAALGGASVRAWAG
jgi:hypothetical protein